MIAQFNRILKAFGANRVELQEVDRTHIKFEIIGWSKFTIFMGGEVVERGVEGTIWSKTKRSRWLHAISLGKKRDEEGRIV